MKQISTMILLILTILSFSLAQRKDNNSTGASEIIQLITQLEKEGREATLKNDPEASDRLLAEDWMNINANGTLTKKAELIQLLKTSPFKFLSVEDEDVMIRVYGFGAIVTGLSIRKRTGEGDSVLTQRVRFTRVYAKQKGEWKVVAAQSTQITL